LKATWSQWYSNPQIFFARAKKEQKNVSWTPDKQEKHWKFSEADVKERILDDYMEAYEDMIRHTATKHAPWYVVPADNKWFTGCRAAAVIEALADWI